MKHANQAAREPCSTSTFGLSGPGPAASGEVPFDASEAENELAKLWSAARHEIAQWTAEPCEEGRRNLRARWRKAFLSFQRAKKWIRDRARNGQKLPEGVYPAAEHAPRVRLALRETRDALKHQTPPPLPLVQRGQSEIVPRVYALVRSFLQSSQFLLKEHSLLHYLNAAQEDLFLELNELWALKPMLQLVALEEIAAALDLLCRDSHGGGEATETRERFLCWPLATLLSLLQSIEHTDWIWIFEQASRTEAILKEDAVYAQMDSESRDGYREVIRELSASSESSETEIAKAAIALAMQAPSCSKTEASGKNSPAAGRRRHVGYYLVDDGRMRLERRIDYRPPFHRKLERAILRAPEGFYVIGIEMMTAGIIAFLLSGLNRFMPPLSALALLLLPATESAVRIMNQLVNFLIRPRWLPKLDFSSGIPAGCATMVVVPTLLLSESQVRKTVDDLEVRYLANPDPNLHFALLTDSRDVAHPSEEKKKLVRLCVSLVERLNRKYRTERAGTFFLFHRDLVYNSTEGAWMGWERKRGKLLDLNNLLRGGPDSFPTKVGDLSILPRIRYIITLDADTQLPRDVGRKLVGTLAHPLNRAIVDPQTNTVTKGYGILQPRVGISISSASRSRLARIYSGQTGFDLYTRATSDVYQDLFGEGSFTGKGIYEVDVYQQVLGRRFPANALLSHDLIEGSYARTGLVSDIEVIDEYPSHFSAYSRRKHRWVRGDWQILRWLFSHVPGCSGERALNPLSFISRWKILDNLRRSLIEAATLALLVAGWFFLPGGPVYWTIATLVLIVLPSYLQFFISLTLVMDSENWSGAVKQAVNGLVVEQVNVLFTIAFLLHQALMTLDAIVRTLVRLVLTHKRLLEWETAAETELGEERRTPVEFCLDLTPWVSLGLAISLASVCPHSLPEALPFLFAWACSGAMRHWIDSPLPPLRYRLSAEDTQFLRKSALCTWRFFREWGGRAANGLVPDNVQETPLASANIISPTNLGMLLAARLAAFDLGYLTAEDFAEETELTLTAALRLPRFKGHFYNWNDIQTLQPLPPLFVSTVDSGNLAACLWILKQGCAELEGQPLFRKAYWNALRDLLALLRELAGKQPSSAAIATLEELHGIFDACGDEPGLWILSLPELEEKAAEVLKSLPQDNGLPERCALVWWSAELRARLAAIRATAENFTPWLLPKYRAFFLRPGTRPIVDAADITLGTLPGILGGLADRLHGLSESDDISPRVRSDARMTLGVTQACSDRLRRLLDSLRQSASIADALVAGMDFRFLYNSARRVLSVGYSVAADRLEKSCYDFLASEARTASFVAIAKGDIGQRSWFQLGRRHTVFHGQRTLMSWSGTMFEYLMPALWMKSYGDTILGQSQNTAVRCQKILASKARRPWGVSEAAYALRDATGRYQYKSFGLPPLALKQDITPDVVSPYATFLALPIDPHAAMRNLKRMQRKGWFGVYGFYESADYNPPGGHKGSEHELVRAWMAHHQGMILLALSNQLSASAMQRRFHAEPRVQATEFILHEHVPDSMPVVPAEAPLLSVG